MIVGRVPLTDRSNDGERLGKRHRPNPTESTVCATAAATPTSLAPASGTNPSSSLGWSHLPPRVTGTILHSLTSTLHPSSPASLSLPLVQRGWSVLASAPRFNYLRTRVQERQRQVAADHERNAECEGERGGGGGGGAGGSEDESDLQLCSDWPVLTDWLIDVAAEDDLRPETVHSAVTFVNVLLSAVTIRRSKFQLLGAAALFVAAKLHETDEAVPSLDHLVDLGAEAYTRSSMGAAEATLFSILRFDLCTPTVWSFATHYLSLLPSEVRHAVTRRVQYLSEVSLLRHDLVAGDPWVTAAAVVVAALTSLPGQNRQSAYDLWYSSGFVVSGLDPVAEPLASSIKTLADVRAQVGPDTDLAAVYLKYRELHEQLHEQQQQAR